MILINMMMAIINLSFEEIKENKDQYKNKFELLDYMKRTTREMIGLQVAEPIVPVYSAVEGDKDGDGDVDEDDMDPTEKMSTVYIFVSVSNVVHFCGKKQFEFYLFCMFIFS